MPIVSLIINIENIEIKKGLTKNNVIARAKESLVKEK